MQDFSSSPKGSNSGWEPDFPKCRNIGQHVIWSIVSGYVGEDGDCRPQMHKVHSRNNEKEEAVPQPFSPLWHLDVHCPLSLMAQVTVNAGCRFGEPKSKTVSKDRNLLRAISKPWRKSPSNRVRAGNTLIDYVTYVLERQL